MPTYTFYPLLESGLSLTFTAVGLRDDAEAMGYASLVLAEHPSAREVAVWEGERRVGAPARAPAPSFRPPEPGRILVVEDSYFQAEDLREAFLEAGYGDVVCSGAAESAIANLESRPPALAILDLDLGEGPAFRVAEALEARGVPFLFFTAYDRPQLPPRWRSVGHFLKPVSSRRVVEASQALLKAER